MSRRRRPCSLGTKNPVKCSAVGLQISHGVMEPSIVALEESLRLGEAQAEHLADLPPRKPALPAALQCSRLQNPARYFLLRAKVLSDFVSQLQGHLHNHL